MAFKFRLPSVYGDYWRRQDAEMARLAEQQKQKQAIHILKELSLQSRALTHADISKWRAAHQLALDVENPKRCQLYDIYDYTTAIDTHLAGVVNRTKYGIMARKFKLIDGKGGENREATAILQAPWFMKFLSLALDAEYYGHSLIQFGNIVKTETGIAFDNVELIPRRHVCPEFGVILRDQSDEPQKGIPYRQPPFSQWVVEAGEPDALGLFLKVTPHVISKKHVQIFWDNFAERFGIPLIYAELATNNPADRTKIENMMASFGTQTWGVFPSGVKLQLLETKGGDAFRVFDERINRANKEISIGLAGQTMAFEDGASRSQSEVHERGFEEIMWAMAVNLRFLINTRLMPLLAMHGFPVQGLSFDWDDSYDFTATEMKDIELMLLNNCEIDPAYFAEKYNIPITGKRAVVGGLPMAAGNPREMAQLLREWNPDFFA